MTYAVRYTRAFADSWPFVAEHVKRLWGRIASVDCACLDEDPPFSDPERTTRLLLLGVAPDEEYTDLPALQEIGTNRSVDEDTDERWRRAGVHVYTMRNESHWSASLAEFAIGMTIASLRRIPHLHHAVHHSPSCWDYSPRRDQSGAYIRATQFGDAVKFVGGTIAGKRVRVGGLGNIGARYAAACRFLGADVAAWDPMAADSVFLSHGIRRVHHQAELFADADIAAPMMPERPQTKGLFDAASIDSIPRGALLLLVTRAGICDMDRVRHRVISGELALAADVFDVEPIPLDDPLLSLDHVVVTPHVAGRTRHANEQYAEQLLDQFRRTP